MGTLTWAWPGGSEVTGQMQRHLRESWEMKTDDVDVVHHWGSQNRLSFAEEKKNVPRISERLNSTKCSLPHTLWGDWGPGVSASLWSLENPG